MKIWIMFGVLVVILLGAYLVIAQEVGSDEASDNDLCSIITGTPSWVKDGNVIGGGYGFVERYSSQSFNDEVNDFLIPNEITMVWDPECGWCQRQIEAFGESWDDYVNSGLTKECNI